MLVQPRAAWLSTRSPDLGPEASIAALALWSTAAGHQPALPTPSCCEIRLSNRPDSLGGHKYWLHLMLRARSKLPGVIQLGDGSTWGRLQRHLLATTSFLAQTLRCARHRRSVPGAWRLRGGMIQIIREGFLEEVALMGAGESQQLHIGWEWDFQAEKSLQEAAGRPPSARRR